MQVYCDALLGSAPLEETGGWGQREALGDPTDTPALGLHFPLVRVGRGVVGILSPLCSRPRAGP